MARSQGAFTATFSDSGTKSKRHHACTQKASRSPPEKGDRACPGCPCRPWGRCLLAMHLQGRERPAEGAFLEDRS